MTNKQTKRLTTTTKTQWENGSNHLAYELNFLKFTKTKSQKNSIVLSKDIHWNTKCSIAKQLETISVIGEWKIMVTKENIKQTFKIIWLLCNNMKNVLMK
jgi:hypothetical protein